MPSFRRSLFLSLAVVILGGVIFLATWEAPPPTVQVEVVIPDDQLPQ